MPATTRIQRITAMAILLGAATVVACAGESQPSPTARVSSLSTADSTMAAAHEVTLYKTATCGCCKEYVGYLRANGFKVVERDTSNVEPVKRAFGVDSVHQSCHTSTVAGYVIEGHVPADLIVRLLSERPDVTGLAVPGMPHGSPGMEMGDHKEPYRVLAFRRADSSSVYAER